MLRYLDHMYHEVISRGNIGQEIVLRRVFPEIGQRQSLGIVL